MNSRIPFKTTSRKLEQFLYVHDILYMYWHKAPDGMTEWVYSLDAEGMRVLEEYRRIVARRNQRKEYAGI